MNDQFKNLFKGIVFILLLVVVLLCLSITFHSCRSQKQATTTVVENVEVAKAASTTTETAARTQWMSKRASIGKADLAERNASRCARQVDSVASHRTMDKSDHYARDTVGIYKPPNITWWPWAILAALALVLTGKYLLRK